MRGLRTLTTVAAAFATTRTVHLRLTAKFISMIEAVLNGSRSIGSCASIVPAGCAAGIPALVDCELKLASD